ncbi:NAD-glutamate dehydrogenase [Nocardioides ultimimeridianus]
MSTTTQGEQATLGERGRILTEAADAARPGRGGTSGGPPRDQLLDLLRDYFHHASTDELARRTPIDLYDAFASHWHWAADRRPHEAKVRVFTPTVAEHGWSADGHSVVEIVVDDMPFLVDSVALHLTENRHSLPLLLHPTFDSREHPGQRESWMHLEIGRVDAEEAARLTEALTRVLCDVRAAVEDWPLMLAKVGAVVEEFAESPPPVSAEEVHEATELLGWLIDEHFTFLGYREYLLTEDDTCLQPVAGSGLGILRDTDSTGAAVRMPDAVREKATEKTLLVLAKANARATVHRAGYLDYVGVKLFAEDGRVIGERRILGLFTSSAYTESVLETPVVRAKVDEIVRRSGLDPRSHDGSALIDTIEGYPREELFHTPATELSDLVEAAMQARERRAVRVLIRRDTYGRYLSVLAYLPRDRYNTAVRERFQRILGERFDASSVDFHVSISESATARVYFVVRMPVGRLLPDDIGTADLERSLLEASRSWHDGFADAVDAAYGEQAGATLVRRYADAFPESYKEDFDPRAAAADIGRIEDLGGEEGIDFAVYADVDAADEVRLKVFRVGGPISLSGVLPMLTSLGVEVLDERPHELSGLPSRTFVYDFGLRCPGGLADSARAAFTDALRAMWEGRAETDGFNRLVLRAGLDWRQATVLRAYAAYLRQGSSPFTTESIETGLADNVDLARLLVRLFETRFDPARSDDTREHEQQAVVERIERALDEVVSLDHDRILRSYLTLIRATLRTNHFQTLDGRYKDYLSLKLEPSVIPDLPEPRPRFEIFVYSPRVEGVHLRFGAVARGGLRWSDRRDDFRTEILGLVKAQMVKNTVIVPVGAKGGFYAKRLPDPGQRDAWLAEGVACYQTFIRGLLDLTDNLVDGETVPPTDLVRHDGDDSYLVVAADKGTATFSDIANAVAADYGFWLGDAFASGGSVGYDHKAMGITARGAWVSVRRHFRELGIDCQSEDFTAVGVGDMSGDVFGNGMLCSEHTRLVAAFDHRDIFIDPEPDSAASYAERKRLFELPRSSWQDYDKDLISEGGGVFPRTAKSIRLTPQIRAALGIDESVEKMTPNDLIHAILLAPVDLLWNGGIGTYVKSRSETNAEVGDKANDAIRVDGGALRARVVGEGGNLGLTQRGRIEYAEAGGRVNTDFIDNSAGVDTSDHEVNLKILLDRVVAGGDLTTKQRNALLASMTDEVADLVLRDNADQNTALANAAKNAPSLLHVHEHWMRQLESEGLLDRELEALPDSKEVARRIEAGGALTQPELAVLMSYTKLVLADRLLATDLPEDPYLEQDLIGYFPSAIREGYAEQIADHPLRREIIVTQVVGDLVNGAGMTYWPRLAAETGADVADLTRANFVAREIYASLPWRQEVAELDNVLDAGVQTRLRVEMRTLVERASRWLLTHRRGADSQETVDHFAGPVQATLPQLPELLSGRELSAYDERRATWVAAGVPEEMAGRAASFEVGYALLHVVDIARAQDLAPDLVARVHFAVGERLGLPVLQQRIVRLPRADQWQTMARAALRDDLHAVHAELTAQLLADADSPADTDSVELVAAWESRHAADLERAATLLGDVCSDEDADLARVSVGLRAVRSLLS